MYKKMSLNCRSCLLSTNQRYFPLLAVLPELENNTILYLLNCVTSSKINCWKNLPGQICEDCLKKLKNAYNFIMQFKRNQVKLQKNTNNDNKNIETNKLEATIKKEDKNIREILNSANTDKILIVNEDETIYNDSDDENNIFEDQKSKKDEYLQSSDVDLQNELEPDPLEEVEKSEVNNKDQFSDIFKDEEVVTDTEPEDTKVDKDIQILTVEDVRKFDRRRLSEKKTILSVEDVINAAKPGKKIKKDHENEQTFNCPFCPKSFNTNRKLRLHKMGIHNPNWEKRFKCDVCGCQLKTLSQHKYHMTKHENLSFACDQCDKAYLTKSKLKEHVRNKHEDTLENKYLCTDCGRGFKYSHALAYHMKIHTNSRNYVCRFCGHASIALSGLKRHERTHTGERPYECKYCKKTFAGAAEKRKHELNHEGVFPYKCTYCGKAYVQTYNMKVHWMQHRGPYECEVCKRGYADAEILKFHYAHSHKIKDVVIEEVEMDSDECGDMDDLSQ